MTLDKDWVLVPRVATDEMCQDGHQTWIGYNGAKTPKIQGETDTAAAWRAMLAAAPPPLITDEMVERGARALCIANGGEPDNFDVPRVQRWEFFSNDARACLEAALRPGGGA